MATAIMPAAATAILLATAETLAIMNLRFGGDVTGSAAYGETTTHRGVGITLLPAGHVLGSAQVMPTCDGKTVIVSGDYKRRT